MVLIILMKICSDCKYFKPDTSMYGIRNQIAFGHCTNQNAIRSISYHTGNVEYFMATQMRKYSENCGQNAKYYLDKNDVQPIVNQCNVFCTDCKYNKPDDSLLNTEAQLEYAQCTHPSATTIDMVTGSTIYEYSYIMRRKANDHKSCGANGTLFEKSDNPRNNKKNRLTEMLYSCAMVIAILMLVLFML